MAILRKFATKLVVAALIVSAVPLVVVGVYAYSRISRSLEAGALEVASGRISRAASNARFVLARVDRDALFLTELVSLHRLVEARATEEPELDRDLLSFLAPRPLYREVSYVDEAGHNFIRVDWQGHVVWAGRGEEYEEKETFARTVLLEPGQVWTSAVFFDGHEGESGPDGAKVMRWSAPVFDSRGRRRGIIVLTVVAEEILQRAVDALRGEGVASFVADEWGHYLYHSSPEKRWSPGAATGLDTLAGDFPEFAGRLPPTRPAVRSLVGGKEILVVGGLRFGGPAAEHFWTVGQVYRRATVFRPVDAFRVTFLLLLSATVVVAGSVAAALAHHLTEPIRELQGGLRRIGSGELDCRVSERWGDEFGDLARAFNSMSNQLKQYVGDLEKTTAARARTEAELRTARDIQQMLLPHKFPPFPHLPGVDVYARNLSASEVGGDFYDFFSVGENVVAVTLGDVSGKGVPAALLMIMATTLLRTFALRSESPSEILRDTDRALLERTSRGMFVTTFFALYRSTTRELLYANAGHPAPLLVTSEGTVEALTGADLPLGVDESFHPEESAAQLNRGDRMLLYSDGLAEARDRRGVLFGSDRITELLCRHAGLPAKDLCERVIQAVVEYQAGEPQFDDLTVLVLEVR